MSTRPEGALLGRRREIGKLYKLSRRETVVLPSIGHCRKPLAAKRCRGWPAAIPNLCSSRRPRRQRSGTSFRGEAPLRLMLYLTSFVAAAMPSST